MKLLPLVLSIFAASSVVAEKQVLYFCYNKNAHKHKQDPEVQKFGANIDDAFAENVVNNMAAWSDDKYLADYYGRRSKKAIIVNCKEKAKSQDKALEAIAEQERIVKENIGSQGWLGLFGRGWSA